jgi:hypothetical protein
MYNGIIKLNKSNCKMFIKIPQNGYHYGPDAIAKIEEMYNAKYMGYWCTKNLRDGWNESPVDVFYVVEPDRSKGHTNYFGMFMRGDTSYITDASSAFTAPITGILTKDGEVIVSRFRHDCIMKDGYMIDGGRDYLRCSADSLQTFVNVSVKDGEFVLEVQNNDSNFEQDKEKTK